MGDNVIDDVAALERLAKTAHAASDWQSAWEHWSSCAQRAKLPKLSHLLGRGWAAFNLQRYEAARDCFEEAERFYPQHHKATLGKAQTLAQLGQWEQAVVTWDRLFRRFPDTRIPRNLIVYSKCLAEIGQPRRAVEVLDEILLDNPDDVLAIKQKSYLFLKLGRPEDSLELNMRLLPDAPQNFELNLQHLLILLEIKDLPGARIALKQLLTIATTAADLARIFQYIPTIFAGWERISFWIAIKRSLESMATNATSNEAKLLDLRLMLALGDRHGFLAGAGALEGMDTDRRVLRLRRAAEVMANGKFPDFKANKVFGIGLSKTGTSSLAQALEILGLQTADYINDLTQELIKLEDAFLFDAMTDTPVCQMFESLYYLFPNSKFVYTVRSLESWTKSFFKHFKRNYRKPTYESLEAMLINPELAPYGIDLAVVRGSLYFHHENAQAAYAAHNHRVLSFFRANEQDRLLVFDIEAGDGWDKLCAFLGKPVPDAAFPWANKAPPSL